MKEPTCKCFIRKPREVAQLVDTYSALVIEGVDGICDSHFWCREVKQFFGASLLTGLVIGNCGYDTPGAIEREEFTRILDLLRAGALERFERGLAIRESKTARKQ